MTVCCPSCHYTFLHLTIETFRVGGVVFLGGGAPDGHLSPEVQWRAGKSSTPTDWLFPSWGAVCQPKSIWPPWRRSQALGGHSVGGLSSVHPPRGSAHRHEAGRGEDGEGVDLWSTIATVVRQLLFSAVAWNSWLLSIAPGKNKNMWSIWWLLNKYVWRITNKQGIFRNHWQCWRQHNNGWMTFSASLSVCQTWSHCLFCHDDEFQKWLAHRKLEVSCC